MSEMVLNKGVIKRLSTPATSKVVYEKLKLDGLVDSKWDEVDDNGVPTYIDDENYEIINRCIFDVSDAPNQYDAETDVFEAERLNDTDYRIHLYYYNGAASMSEVLETLMPEADKRYQNNDKEIELQKILDKHGVLTQHGWSMHTGSLEEELMRWSRS